MIDFKSMRLSGAVSIGRARVLWHEGELRAYTKDGLVFQATSTAPIVQEKRWRPCYIAQTQKGDVLLKTKCSTCGGWGQVTRVPAETLWGTV